MSRFVIFSIVIVICAIQLADSWENSQGEDSNDNNLEYHKVLERVTRSSRSSNEKRNRSRTLRTLRRETSAKEMPCKCEGGVDCKCCARVSVGSDRQTDCVAFKIPDFNKRSGRPTVKYNYSFNNNKRRSSQTATFRDGNSSVQCEPYRRYPNFIVCMRVTTTMGSDGRPRFCPTVEGRYFGQLFYRNQFNCVTHEQHVQQQQQWQQQNWGNSTRPPSNNNN